MSDNRFTGVFKEILDASDPNRLVDFCIFFKWTKNYSMRNCLLVYAQRPGAVMLHTAYQWNRLYGRRVKPGVSPIVVLSPKGPVHFVYDYNDTYGGQELPELLRGISVLKDVDIPEYALENFIYALATEGITCTYANFGSRQGAQISLLDTPMTYKIHTSNNKVKSITTDLCITLNSEMDSTTNFTSLIHELGHLFCGHLPRGEHTPKDIHFADRQDLSSNQKEFEAEMTVQTVCRLLGMNADINAYLSGYQNPDGSMPDVDRGQIFGAADKILELVPEEILKHPW